MKLRLDTESLMASLKVFVRSFCAEIILCVILYVIAEFNLHRVFKFDDYIFAYYPMLIIFTFVLNMLLKKSWRILYYISIFTFVPLLFLDLKHSVFTVSYFFGLLLSAFALIGYRKCRDNEAFARNFVKTLLDLLFSFIVYNILAGVVSVIIMSVEYIFNLSTYKCYPDVYFFSVIIVFPLTFFFMQMHKSQDEWNMPRFIEMIVNYIICPAIIIYTVILYLYFIKIAIEWELPKGGIAFMVMGYFIVALLGRMLCSISRRQFYNWFFDRYSIISIPPVILFWIGLIYRVKLYSLTESRVYLLAAGVLMCLLIFMMLSRKYCRYRLMLLIASVFIVILTYIPGISAKSIGIISQKERMEKYIRELNLKDAGNGFIRTDSAYLDSIEKDSVKREIYNQFLDCYDYLSEEIGADEVKKQYGTRIDMGTDKEQPEFRVKLHLYFTGDFNTADYPVFKGYISDDKQYSWEDSISNGKLIVKSDGREILKADIQQRLDKYKYSEFGLPSDLFVYQNDSLRIIIDAVNVVETENGKLVYRGVDGINLFKKSIDGQRNPSLGN